MSDVKNKSVLNVSNLVPVLDSAVESSHSFDELIITAVSAVVAVVVTGFISNLTNKDKGDKI